MDKETAFVWDASGIKFGSGATREVGQDMKRLGAHRVLVVTDPGLADGEPVHVTLQALRAASIDAVLFDRVRIEPTDISFREVNMSLGTPPGTKMVSVSLTPEPRGQV